MKSIQGLNIKHIILKRFKSYREMLYMDELSKGVNLIIGANGNGKSNFLDSIIYVLTDKYQNMRQEDKKLLLHEDITDKSEDSAKLSVELVIDNKSHRFPIEKDQISIMKLFDTKEGKEEIVINQKRLLKSDVQNSLEGAGFMKTNPYYIIQQGKINQILNCTDEEYFDIFCDAMGTKIYEEKMVKTLSQLQYELSTIRAGRANPAVLDRITVEYYGTDTPINQIASISSPDPRSLLIQPWDASALKSIEKAILASDLGINPQNDGRAIRLIFPQLTEERRKELAKQVKKYAEEAKVAVRNIRRDAVDKFKAEKKKSEITEDDLKIAEKDLQKLTDDFIKEVEKIGEAKEKELMEL